MERLIFHIDVNSAFLSWEAARRVKQGLPDLREIPAVLAVIRRSVQVLWLRNQSLQRNTVYRRENPWQWL